MHANTSNGQCKEPCEEEPRPPNAGRGIELRLLLLALFVATATTEILHACFR